jgi:hypothetical protein
MSRRLLWHELTTHDAKLVRPEQALVVVVFGRCYAAAWELTLVASLSGALPPFGYARPAALLFGASRLVYSSTVRPKDSASFRCTSQSAFLKFQAI